MIDVVLKQVVVNCSAERAFAVFFEQIDHWWPKAQHSVAATKGLDKAPSVICEQREGGRIYETSAAGGEHQWGRIMELEPTKRAVFSWHVGRAETEATEVEVRFVPFNASESRVELEHRKWEVLGDSAGATRENYDSGWDFVFIDCFGSACN
ncbi:SRPBCC family protein [Pelagibius sp. Alg239-R121]|uniref:SRPBCC family protein n=1 Tax=Pelagibius sp. Alg239-R121 TaxID=2993448 RepID=UPI0024A6501B|nr:SRPBCC family protein [Pelagibius sp. Alg239-R121]